MEKIKLIDLTTHRYVSRLNEGNQLVHCEQYVFFDETSYANCAMNAPNSVINVSDNEALFSHCTKENRYYQCVSSAKDDIVIEDKKYYLIKCVVDDDDIKFDCTGCAFLDNIRCKLVDYRRQNIINKSVCKKCVNGRCNYIWIEASKVDLIKPQDIEKENVTKLDKEDMDKYEKDECAIPSTGVEVPNNNGAPKERKTATDDTRRLTVDLGIEKARMWYKSMNSILKNLALKVYSKAELEDARVCTALIDIDTAKRLYRNVEKAVRDFVLTAFTEDELKR